MSVANQSQPRAQGDLSKTPFAHLVLYLHREGLSGTLVIARGGFETKVLFRNGRAVAARPIPRGAALQDGLLELCALHEGAYGFWDGDLVGDAIGVIRGTVDPFTFVNESRRGHVRDQVIAGVVERYRGLRVSLVPDADLKRLGLRGIEARVAEQLRRQARLTEEFIEQSELAPSEARKLMYLLLVTKYALPEGMDASSASGVRSAISGAPGPAARSTLPPGASAAPSVRPPSHASTVRPSTSRSPSTPAAQPSRSPSEPGFSTSLPPAGQTSPPARASSSPSAPVPAWQQLASLRPGSAQPGSGRSVPPPPSIPTPSMAPPPVEALDEAGKLRRAEQLAERRNLAEAARIVDDLIACDPKNADSQAMRAWILYQQFTGARPPRPLLDAIESALRLNEEHPRALYVKGLIFKRIGKQNDAVRYFQRALDANPQHIEAQRELRLAKMRRER
jgi:Domain of unknown function (DUF4388)